MGKPDAEQWPSWPNGQEGGLLVNHVEVDLPVDQLFKLWWEPGSAFTADANSARGYRGFVETGWLPPGTPTPASPDWTSSFPSPSSPPTRPPALGEYAARSRKVQFSAQAMGMRFTTEEVQRCSEAKEGKLYQVDSCVATTAKYGDKFRTVIRHRMAALSDSRSELSVRYEVVFIAPVGMMLKPVITKGVDGGLKKSYQQALEALRKRGVGVRDLEAKTEEEARAAGAAAAARQAGGGGAARGGVSGPVGSGLGALEYTLTLGVTEDLVMALTPLAAFVHSLLLPGRGQYAGEARGLSKVFVAIGLVVGLCVTLSVLQQLQAMCDAAPGWLPTVIGHAVSLLGGPLSVRQVGSALAVAALVQSGMRAVFKAKEPMFRTSSEARQGVLYPGYSSTIQRAMRQVDSNQSTSSTSSFSAAAAAAVGEAGPASAANGGVGGGMSEAMKSFKVFGKWVQGALSTSPRPSARDAGGSSSSPASPSLRPFDSASSPALVEGLEGGVGGAPEGRPGGHSGMPTPSVSGVASPGALSSAASGTLSPQRPQSPQSMRRARSQQQPGREGPAVAAGEDPPLSRRQPSLGGGPGDNLSSFLKASWSQFIATESSGSLAAAGGSGPASGLGSPVGSMGAAAGMLSPSPASSQLELRTLATSSTAGVAAGAADGGAALPGPLDDGRRQAALHENERFQPLRGWGHTWPGHFLPTDRVGHWSTADGRTSSTFDEVAPALAEGWDWVEPEWRVDLSGVSEGMADEEGWRYAIDFSVMKPLAQTGSGKKKIKDFVRRRTWVRTCVRRQELTAQPSPTKQGGADWTQEADKEDVSQHGSGSSSSASTPRHGQQQRQDRQPEEPPSSSSCPGGSPCRQRQQERPEGDRQLVPRASDVAAAERPQQQQQQQPASGNSSRNFETSNVGTGAATTPSVTAAAAANGAADAADGEGGLSIRLGRRSAETHASSLGEEGSSLGAGGEDETLCPGTRQLARISSAASLEAGDEAEDDDDVGPPIEEAGTVQGPPLPREGGQTPAAAAWGDGANGQDLLSPPAGAAAGCDVGATDTAAAAAGEEASGSGGGGYEESPFATTLAAAPAVIDAAAAATAGRGGGSGTAPGTSPASACDGAGDHAGHKAEGAAARKAGGAGAADDNDSGAKSANAAESAPEGALGVADNTSVGGGMCGPEIDGAAARKARGAGAANDNDGGVESANTADSELEGELGVANDVRVGAGGGHNASGLHTDGDCSAAAAVSAVAATPIASANSTPGCNTAISVRPPSLGAGVGGSGAATPRDGEALSPSADGDPGRHHQRTASTGAEFASFLRRLSNSGGGDGGASSPLTPEAPAGMLSRSGSTGSKTAKLARQVSASMREVSSAASSLVESVSLKLSERSDSLSAVGSASGVSALGVGAGGPATSNAVGIGGGAVGGGGSGGAGGAGSPSTMTFSERLSSRLSDTNLGARLKSLSFKSPNKPLLDGDQVPSSSSWLEPPASQPQEASASPSPPPPAPSSAPNTQRAAAPPPLGNRGLASAPATPSSARLPPLHGRQQLAAGGGAAPPAASPVAAEAGVAPAAAAGVQPPAGVQPAEDDAMPAEDDAMPAAAKRRLSLHATDTDPLAQLVADAVHDAVGGGNGEGGEADGEGEGGEGFADKVGVGEAGVCSSTGGIVPGAARARDEGGVSSVAEEV